MAADGFDPVRFLERAVRTPSHEDVGPMRELLRETLAEHGVDARVDDAGNVLATRTAGGDTAGIGDGDEGPHLLLNTHVDTVPPHVPFERDGDVIRGRGACDAKGPLAALLAAFLGRPVERGRLTLAVTPDEETYSTGAASLDVDADACIVGEPTGLDVCTAAKGRFEGTVEVRGESAHAAEPASGTNALLALRGVLDALETFDDREDVPDEHPDLGRATLTPTTVEGGAATNQIPARCAVTVDRRSVPPETGEGFARTLAAHLREHVGAATVEFALTERETPFLEAFATPTDDPLVRVLSEASGGAVRPFGAATEASYFAARAPTVVFGPGDLADETGPVAHADREYVEVPEVRAAARAVGATVDAFCGPASAARDVPDGR